MIHAVVLRELILNSVERKLPARDAVRVASNQSAKVKRILNVLLERVETQHDIAKRPISISCQQRKHSTAIVRYHHLKPVSILQRVETDVVTIRTTKMFLRD